MYLYALFEHDFTDAHESHQSLNLNDVHMSLGQKQFKAPDRTNIKIYNLISWRKVKDIQLKESWWRYLRHGCNTF